jgi:glycosyltransferase involved in cell wall biosynthesis
VSHLRREHDVTVLTSDWRASETPREAHVRRELPYVLGHRRDVPKAVYFAQRAARVMRQVLDQHRPEAIFIWNGTRIPQVALRVAHAHGAPVVFSIMEHWFSRLYEIDYFTRILSAPGGPRGVWPAAVLTANALHPSLRISTSPALPCSVIWNARIMRDINPLPKSVVVLRDIVIPVGSPRDVEYSRVPRLPVTPPMALFAGRVVPEKGPDLLIDALGRALKAGIAMRATLAGPIDPSYAASLRERSRAVGLDEAAISMPGPLDSAGLGRLLSQAFALVIPSRWQEPAPLVAVEAAFANVPIVASRSGGMPDQFAEDREALFFDIDDADGLTSSLLDVLANPRRTEARARSARVRTEEYRFSDYVSRVERFLVECAQDVEHAGAGGLV